MTCQEFRGLNLRIKRLEEATRAERAALGTHFRECAECFDWTAAMYPIGNASEEEKAQAVISGFQMAIKDRQDPEAR